MTKAIELSQLGSNLDVGTEIESSLPLRTSNAAYGNNTNVPYLIAGTSGYTGATTNWNTFGIQHRFKSTSAGVPRVTIDNIDGELFCIEHPGNVGIGTNNPLSTLHVQNNSGTTGGDLQRWTADTGTNVRSAILIAPEVDDPNDPFIFFTNNSWQFRVDTTDAVTISSTGSFGIGTDSPSSLLHLKSTGAEIIQKMETSTGTVKLYANNDDLVVDADSYRFRSEDGATEYARIGNNGNVGIGTNNPNKTLHVEGSFGLSGYAHLGATNQNTTNLRDSQTTTNRTPKVQINSQSGPGSSLGLISWHSSTAGYYSPQLWLAKSNASDNTIGTNTLVTDGTDLGAINFAGNDGAAFLNAASIRAEVDGTAATDDMPGRLVFFTNGGAVNPTERMRIDSSGNVGIGTNNPARLLELSSSAPRLRITDNDTAATASTSYLEFHGNNARTAVIYTASGNLNLQTDSGVAGNIRFLTGGAANERMRIDPSGGVGIGWAGTANQNLQINDSSTPKIRFSRDTSYYWDIGHTSSDFQFESETGGVIMHMNFNGNVGIGTNNPDAKLDVNGGVAIQRPSNYWQNNTQVFFDDSTNLIGSIGHHGGFALALTSNGYRNSSGQWTSHGINSFTGAAQVEVQPQGNIYFRTDSNKATGSSTNPTTRIHIDSLGRMRVGGATPLYALDVRGESMSGLEYKAISSENGVLARECAGFGQASDNSAGCGLECILFQNNINNNWVAFDLFIRASSCATTGASHASAWFFYRCRAYAQNGFSFTQVDAGGDTGSVTIAINDDGNVGTAIGLGSDADARQFEVRMSVSGGQRSTLSVFVNSYPKIARFRRQP